MRSSIESIKRKNRRSRKEDKEGTEEDEEEDEPGQDKCEEDEKDEEGEEDEENDDEKEDEEEEEYFKKKDSYIRRLALAWTKIIIMEHHHGVTLTGCQQVPRFSRVFLLQCHLIPLLTEFTRE